MRETNRRLALALSLTGTALATPIFAAPDAVGFSKALPLQSYVVLESAQLYDFTFAAAPVDWRVQSGQWERASGSTRGSVVSYSASWFAGRSDDIAAIWNKHEFSGDFSTRVMFAFKEGSRGPKDRWQEHPSDFAISFCGDGKNLGSGYTLIIGADGNSHTVLQKQGAVVAETAVPDALFTSLTDVEERNKSLRKVAGPPGVLRIPSLPPSREFFTGYDQSYWSYARIDKMGDRIQCWLGDRLLFAYNDPQPLDAGQFALWTYNNDVQLFRMKVFYENEVKNGFLRPQAAPVVPTPIATFR